MAKQTENTKKPESETFAAWSERMVQTGVRNLNKLVGIVLLILVYTQFTLFVVQPIGAIPEGRTLLILRTGKLNFIDSGDGLCEREMGGVSLLCRMATLAQVAQNSNVIVRLPYSETLYLISTGGKTYDR
jgi:hypothetical protein